MQKDTLHIKNMVCMRCVSAVKKTLESLEIPYVDVKLGEVVLNVSKKNLNIELLDSELKRIGFELIDDDKSKIVNKIKTEIINYIYFSGDVVRKINFSDYIAEKTGLNYPYLSRLFSSVEAHTIEKYLILQKIEKVKELLVYDELTLSEISYELDYSSVQHLSRQFKSVTGLTPSAFKKLTDKSRKPLDEI